MALSTREVLMIIRAKDLASAELARVGASFGGLGAQIKATEAALDSNLTPAARRAALAQHELQQANLASAQSLIHTGSALAGIGLAFGVAGAAAISFFKGSADVAMEYNRQSALTLTQVDQLGVTLKDVGDIGIRVARDVAVPFDTIQDGLYDIFSSMEVNVKEAEVLLGAMAKSAVAGQTDIQTAGRSTIAIMNAFKIPVEEVERVLDVQFQTVRKGVITYEELATTIGRAIPSAVKAGASVEELGAALSFATRMGLSAAMSATSVARAYDLLSNPKFAKAMSEFGIEVADAEGNFRTMLDVTTDLRNRFEALGYTEEQIAEKLQQLTKGAGGTIQAMRFLNLTVQDSGGLFKELSGDLENASGAFEEAYKIMKDTPAAKIQELKNAWQIFRKEIGDRVLPTIGRLAEIGKTVIDWFLDMDPKLLDAIVKWGKLAAAWLLLTGILLTLHGGFMILQGVLALVGVGMMKIMALVSGWGLLAAAVIYLVTQTELLQVAWDKLSSWATTTFMPAVRSAFDAIKEAWNQFIFAFKYPEAINEQGLLFATLGSTVGGVFQKLKEGAEGFWFAFKHPEAINEQNLLMAEWGSKAGQTFDTAVLGVKAFWSAFNGEGVTSDGFVGLMEQAGVKARETFDGIKTAWDETLTYFTTAIEEHGFVGALGEMGKALWHWIEDNTPVAIEKLGNFGEAVVGWVTDTALPWLLENFAKWGLALIGWISDNAPKAIEELGNLTTAMLNFLGENLPKFIEAGGEILKKLMLGILENLPEITATFLLITGAIVVFIATKLIPEVIAAWIKISDAFGENAFKIVGSVLATFVDTAAAVITYITTTLIPDVLAAFLDLSRQFTQNVAGKIVDAVTAPFKSIWKSLVGNSIIPDTVNAGLAEWNRFKDRSGQTFDELNTNVTGKTEAMKGTLVKLFGETGTDSHNRWKEAIDQMPGSSQQVSEQTYNAITSILANLPGWTGGAGHETQAQWVVNLGKGTGGTRGTTGDWAQAMISILNQLLQGVGAAPIEQGNTAGPQSTMAIGGILDFYARGGIEDHVAQIARAGTMRVWAEPETGGEAYIPLAKAKRSRSVTILKEVADRFGMTLQEYAEGDVNWPAVPDFGAFGNMIGTRGGKDPVTYTREAVIAWDEERKRKLAEEAAQTVGGGSISGGWQAITNYLDSQGVPYQITSTTGGQHAPGSYHYAGKAVDMVSNNMMQIFNTLTQVGSSLAELFHDPAGWSIKNGQRVDWTVGGHGGHVHGAVMDNGGLLARGLSMIANNSGKPEAVFNWEQFQAIEWLMGHADKVAEAAQAAPAPGVVQGAATGVSDHQRLMSMGGKPGYAPSLGMMVETAQHTGQVLAGSKNIMTTLGALTGGIGSIGSGIRANAKANTGLDFGKADGFSFGFGSGSIKASQGPVFNEGAISMQITGSNPEQIAAQVEAKIRALISELRMGRR